MIGILIMTLISFVLSTVLVFTSKYLNENNEKLKIQELLPGYNCGACGYPGCSGMADAILNDKMNYQKCKPLKGEKRKTLEVFLKIK